MTCSNIRSFRLVVLCFAFAAGCSSSGSSAQSTTSTTTATTATTTVASDAGSIVGTTCTSDPQCGAGYGCMPDSIPDAALCTADECTAQCAGFVDPAANAGCMTTCEQGVCNPSALANQKGTCQIAPDSGSTTTTATATATTTTGTTTTTTTAAPLTWSGTWNLTVSYSVSCDSGLGNVSTGTNQQSITLPISGANTSLTATPSVPASDWTAMTGTGNGSGMTLNGMFPFKDVQAATVDSSDNSCTIKITSVTDANNATGTITGSAQNQFGALCTISNGTATLSR